MSVLSAIDGSMPEWHQTAERSPVLDFVNYSLRGVGQVVFMNNPLTGLLILVGMLIASPWLGVAGIIGLVAATATALILGLDRTSTRAGLFGFNGVLVGAGLATFLTGEWTIGVIVTIVLLSAFSTVLHVALSRIFIGAWGVPPYTLAFNLTTLTFLVASLNLANVPLSSAIAPQPAEVAGPAVPTGLRPTPDAPSTVDATSILNAVFRGIGQLFFADNLLSGILIIVGILIASRIAAVFALIGSTFGMLTGLVLGASGSAIYHGLWGFNSFDAALAVGGVFFVLTWRSALYAVACAIVTALIFGALAAAFTPLGLPALTLPFCFGTLAFVLMKDNARALTMVPLDDLDTPEATLRRFRQSPEARASAA